MKWKYIEAVETADEMSDKIKIQLNERIDGSKKITLFCTPGEALGIVRLINERKGEEN